MGWLAGWKLAARRQMRRHLDNIGTLTRLLPGLGFRWSRPPAELPEPQLHEIQTPAPDAPARQGQVDEDVTRRDHPRR